MSRAGLPFPESTPALLHSSAAWRHRFLGFRFATPQAPTRRTLVRRLRAHIFATPVAAGREKSGTGRSPVPPRHDAMPTKIIRSLHESIDDLIYRRSRLGSDPLHFH